MDCQTGGSTDEEGTLPKHNTGPEGYSLRASEAGLGLYVSRRAMIWHYQGKGGRSAVEIYGDRPSWLAQGRKQARVDFGPSTVRSGERGFLCLLGPTTIQISEHVYTKTQRLSLPFGILSGIYYP